MDAAVPSIGPVRGGLAEPDARAARRIFWLAALAFAAVTTILPPVCFPAFRSDVLEQIVIGREWVLGSAKHPALTTWIMQVFWVGTGGSRFAPSLAASVCATATMWAVWRLGRRFVGEREALLGALCLTAYWYTNIGGAAMYNNNVTLIAFWHLAILAFHDALESDRARAWLLTGVLVGCGVLCKYSAVVLAASMAAFMLAVPDARRRLRSAGPWLAVLATTLVVLPHAAFMLGEFGGSYAYLEKKRLQIGILPFCLLLLRDWAIQALIAVPILLVVAPLVGWRPRWAPRPDRPGWHALFLPAMFGLPIAIQTVLQLALRVNYQQRSYGSHLWVLLGLCVLAAFRLAGDPRRWRLAVATAGTLAAVQLASLPVLTATEYRFGSRPRARFYPARQLAERLDAIWEESCVGPCRYLATGAGQQLAGWAAGAYSRHQPHVVDPALGRWARDADVAAHGGIVFWTRDAAGDGGDVPAEIRRRFPRARFRGTVELPYAMLNPDVPAVRLGVAIVEPDDRRLRTADLPKTRR